MPNTNQVHYRISTTASLNEGGNSVAQLQAGTWYHIAYVYDGSNLSLYVDGQLDSTAALAGQPIVNQADWYIGDTPWHVPAVGQIADVNIIQRGLSADEVNAMYQSAGN